jgi:hypothetical protein
MNVSRYAIRTGWRRRQTGFNFSEVLFAVMILGIGFIMIAAIFPVALMQSKTTVEETVGATNARGSVNFIQTAATNITMDTTGGLVVYVSQDPENMTPVPKGAPLWNAIKGNIVLPSDPRYGAHVFYRRADGWPYAQVIVIPTVARNQSSYEKAASTTSGGALPPSATLDRAFLPQPITIAIANNRATIGGAGAAAAAEGSYIVIGDATVPATAARLNGNILRLGPEVGGGVWELSPGWDFTRDPGPNEMLEPNNASSDDITSVTTATGFLVGRGLNDPTAAPGANNAREGPAQDVAAYSTFVLIR